MIVTVFYKVIVYIMSVICAITAPLNMFKQDSCVAKDPENVKLRFATMSDIHLTDSRFRSFVLSLGLKNLESAETPLDALCLLGDNTDHGYTEQYELLTETMAKYTPANKLIMAIGNHDTWTDDEYDEYEPAKENFIKYEKQITGLDIGDKVYYSTEVNGYPFIVMGSEDDHTAAYISNAQLTWLDSELAKASAKGGPIFVLCHWPINQTHGLPYAFDMDKNAAPDKGGIGDESNKVFEILHKYDNIFYITGHVHNGISMKPDKLVTNYASYEELDGVHSINLPSFMYPSVKGNVMNGSGFVFEVYDKEVVIRGRNYISNTWFNNYEISIDIK